jgi:hypothetical protein
MSSSRKAFFPPKAVVISRLVPTGFPSSGKLVRHASNT